MAKDREERIDLRGDGRIVLYKRAGLKDPVWQLRVRVPNSTGYKRVTTKTADQREAERFAINFYEDLYIHVKTGGSIKSKTFKQVFAEWEKHVATMGHTRRGGSWEDTVERVRVYPNTSLMLFDNGGLQCDRLQALCAATSAGNSSRNITSSQCISASSSKCARQSASGNCGARRVRFQWLRTCWIFSFRNWGGRRRLSMVWVCMAR